jgi:putative sporulation protein YtxC
MTNKDIHLSLNKQDEISVKKLLTNHKLDKEYTYNKDYIEVVLKNNSEDKLHNEQITDEIVDLIIDIMENKLIRKYVIKKYSTQSSEEIQNIYMCALNIFKERYFVIKKSLAEKIDDYILNDDYINIEGFVKFRMKEFNNYISTIVDLAWEEYFIQKDQEEFINVLKYFVNIQQEKLDLLRIHIKEDNSFILYDKNGNEIDSINDEDIMNMIIKENLNYEDFLMSNLLTLCPSKIEIIDSLNNNSSKEIIEIIKSIFGDKVTCINTN